MHIITNRFRLLMSIIATIFIGKPQITYGNSTNRSNIILMMKDDMGYDDIGFNGNKIIQTPHLDKLCKEGVKFTNFFSGGSVCSPTRATCLTGRHYYRYGIWTANDGRLPVEELTVPRARAY